MPLLDSFTVDHTIMGEREIALGMLSLAQTKSKPRPAA